MSKKYVMSHEDDELTDDYDYDVYGSDDADADDADDGMYSDFDSDLELDEIEDDELYDDDDSLYEDDDLDIDDERSEARRDMWSNMDWDKD